MEEIEIDEIKGRMKVRGGIGVQMIERLQASEKSAVYEARETYGSANGLAYVIQHRLLPKLDLQGKMQARVLKEAEINGEVLQNVVVLYKI
jgi:hypothetical protein